MVNDDIELVVNSRQRWERLMEDDICSRMADWFKQEYGIYVLVKCTCTEPHPRRSLTSEVPMWFQR